MIVLPTPRMIEELAFERHLSMTEVCRRASISPSVFVRWKSGQSSPTLATVQKMLDALIRQETS